MSVRYGQTKTYKELAEMIDSPNACRAVGSALAKNPIPIIVPCHRIVNSNGKIGEFALGTDAKNIYWILKKHTNKDYSSSDSASAFCGKTLSYCFSSFANF